MQFTDTSEKGFQKYIVKELCTKGSYVESVSNDFDKEFCINTKQLLAFIKQTQTEKEIFNLLNSEASLRSKRELIEKFILENLPEIEDEDNIPQEFDKFWNEEQQKAFKQLIKGENLSEEKTQKLIESDQYNLEWNIKRILSKANYQIHTDAIKNYILPQKDYDKDKEWLVYAEEADIKD